MTESKTTVRLAPIDPGAPVEVPVYATSQSAGADLRAAAESVLEPGQWAAIPTGLRLELPVGCEAQIRPRSGLAAKHGVTVLNAPGTIDADYRGEVKVLLINHGPEPFRIAAGDRIAQMIIAEVIQARFEVVEALEDTARGAGGFGHTGRQ